MFLYLFFTLLSSATVVDEAVAFSIDCAWYGCVCVCVLGRGKQSTYQEDTSNEAMVKQHTLTLNSASKLDLPCECICSTCFRKPSNAALFIRGLSPLLIAPGGRRTDIITMVCACVHAFQWSGIINMAFYHLHFAQGYNTIGPNLGGQLRMYVYRNHT